MERIKSFAENTNLFLTKSNISKKSLILWFILLVLFIAAAVFVYINYIKPQLDVMNYKANYEFDSTDDSKLKKSSVSRKATVYLFWADWCPNSNTESATGKSLHSTWNKITEESKKGTWNVGNDVLTFVKVNECDNDFAAHEATVTKSEIEGFPSIFVVYDDYVLDKDTNTKVKQTIIYELDASPTEETIKNFIKSALHPE
jgi:thiol-disulfide isomerase/thioredoxin